MSRHLSVFGSAAVMALVSCLPAWSQDEMVANPFHKFWAKTKPGATAIHVEKTKVSGPDGKLVLDGEDEKTIVYKLVEANDDRAVVEMVVTEQDFLGQVQAAPTRYLYPAKVKKSRLERIYLEAGGKTGEEAVKVGGKEIKCRTVAGTIKGQNGELTDFKVWLSDDVPGTIVKQVRTSKQKDGVVVETTTTLQANP